MHLTLKKKENGGWSAMGLVKLPQLWKTKKSINMLKMKLAIFKWIRAMRMSRNNILRLPKTNKMSLNILTKKLCKKRKKLLRKSLVAISNFYKMIQRNHSPQTPTCWRLNWKKPLRQQHLIVQQQVRYSRRSKNQSRWDNRWCQERATEELRNLIQ